MDEKEQLIAAYAGGYEKLLAAVTDCPQEKWDSKPSPTSWSITEIIVHVADSEIVGLHRMKRVLAENNPLLTSFDQDAWASQLQYSRLNPIQYLELFRLLRESFIPTLAELTDEDLNRTGIHDEAGKLTFRDLLVKYINHIEDHLRQIERVKQRI
ncbi:DinB family protein [Aneurinibacillus terranovensis]|uniref:DinB family protein n=1 Tax=Aneurinibacillus terranovensis TaxID=278991 RepID=UPI001FDF99A4|nr:DinB family protein [Aneurinibacillus terranovensis]